MKSRTLTATIEISSQLGQAALRKYIKKALEREALINVAQVDVRTSQPVKDEQKFSPGEGGYSDDE